MCQMCLRHDAPSVTPEKLVAILDASYNEQTLLAHFVRFAILTTTGFHVWTKGDLRTLLDGVMLKWLHGE